MKWLYVSIQYLRGESKIKGFSMEYSVKWYSKKMDQENRHWIAVHIILKFVAYLIIAWYTFHIFYCCWRCWVGNVNTVIDIYFRRKNVLDCCVLKWSRREKKSCRNFWSDFFFTSGNFMIKVYFFCSKHYDLINFDIIVWIRNKAIFKWLKWI